MPINRKTPNQFRPGILSCEVTQIVVQEVSEIRVRRLVLDFLACPSQFSQHVLGCTIPLSASARTELSPLLRADLVRAERENSCPPIPHIGEPSHVPTFRAPRLIRDQIVSGCIAPRRKFPPSSDLAEPSRSLSGRGSFRGSPTFACASTDNQATFRENVSDSIL
jgi:hypothetical protein